MTIRRPRQKSEAHLAFIRQLPCLVTGTNIGVDAAHIRLPAIQYGKRPVGTGEKPDDRWAVPLCREEHTIQHSMSERAYWALRGKDPLPIAMALWGVSGDTELGELILSYWRS